MQKWMYGLSLSDQLFPSVTNIFQWDRFGYADKAQEAKRIAAKATSGVKETEREKNKLAKEEKKKRNTAWSEKASKKEERERRRDKKTKKKQWLKTQVMSANEQTTCPKRPRAEEDSEDTWEQLAKEERMAKKLKKGEITQKEFDAEFVDL